MPATAYIEQQQQRDKSVPRDVSSVLGDLRFRALLDEEDWNALPEAVRRRFSKRLSGGATAVYVGTITDVRMSLPGRLLAHALRVVGAPLPLSRDTGVPSVVTVTEDVATGGQIWTRLYANRTSFPQVIHSAKRFSGTTGLEEYIGFGISMALNVRVRNGALVFESAGYLLRIGRLSLRLPRLLDPGKLEVRHTDLGDGRFEFSLHLAHALLGELVHQAGIYREEMP